MPDVYLSVDDLLRRERDFVAIEDRVHGRSEIAVLAPHAGGIEPFTGEIARAVAGREHRLYAFEGRDPESNGRFHVTSTRFDEPRLRHVLDGARAAISIHGAAGEEEALTLIGGVNRSLATAIKRSLERAGFAVMYAPAHLAATDPRNLVNRVPEGGVQLELTRRLRQDLRGGFLRKPLFDRYVGAIRAALAEEAARPHVDWDQFRTQPASPAA
jgi:phage replication-related protein YjqB (UPF0714/DUF867 family)